MMNHVAFSYCKYNFSQFHTSLLPVTKRNVIVISFLITLCLMPALCDTLYKVHVSRHRLHTSKCISQLFEPEPYPRWKW